MNRGRLVAALALALLPAGALLHASEPARDAPNLPGGDTTVPANGRNAFSFPAANLGDAERTRFVIGNSFFRRNWVEAPASTQARDGLGPHFIARSCGGCHDQDGRGAPPPIGADGRHGAPVSLLIRLSVPGVGEHGAPKPEPVYGDQLNNAAVQGVRPEGEIRIRERTRHGRFADGTPYTLRQPSYTLGRLGYGPLQRGTMTSPRVAPQLVGVGLLEAIPEAEILRNASEQAERAARTGSTVRGMPNRVWDAKARSTLVGRFGWKANVATLAHQTGGAFVGDMGITSSLFPDEACTTTQADCRAAPHGGRPSDAAKSADRSADPQPEIDDATFADVVFYQATLAVPARRAIDDPAVQRGEALFHRAGCADCHRPSYVTGASPNPETGSPALARQTIWPYTDLLLHDMGEGLADGRPDYLANGRQWKTPPLWGIGLIPEVNGHQRLLHDGRARGVLEAVLWHGGEADASRKQVLRFSKAEREALVKFVESL
ncbi:MAG TPA: di-heme oxidoredictase family protein [Methylibium sp.]|uniref:di-heme oxidoreductase family protein n=1 Tax=Methylibium sp. TaxID=2067992 RepID=UPI002DB637CC|nr:di-heme oxidoredictase family protein [Methylibium sp.]HEU4457582.1 di-heme oxidoredictase family protein [Methylibium sp.]